MVEQKVVVWLDLADIIKPIVALVPSFFARYKSLKLAQLKSNFISDIIHYDLIAYSAESGGNSINSVRVSIESGIRRGYDSAQRFYFIIAVSSSIL